MAKKYIKKRKARPMKTPSLTEFKDFIEKNAEALEKTFLEEYAETAGHHLWNVDRSLTKRPTLTFSE